MLQEFLSDPCFLLSPFFFFFLFTKVNFFSFFEVVNPIYCDNELIWAFLL